MDHPHRIDLHHHVFSLGLDRRCPAKASSGSDFPYIQGPVLDELNRELDEGSPFDTVELDMINRGNALSLFPRFAAVSL